MSFLKNLKIIPDFRLNFLIPTIIFRLMLDFTNRSVLKIPVGLTIDQLPSHRNEMAQAKAGN